MTSKFAELAIDSAEPHDLARSWCSVLDYEVQDDDDGIVAIGSPAVPDGKKRPGPVPPTLTVVRVPGSRLLDRGARPVDVGQRDQNRVVLADPEGNEFCVLASRCP